MKIVVKHVNVTDNNKFKNKFPYKKNSVKTKLHH